jgi:hypothetical protein
MVQPGGLEPLTYSFEVCRFGSGMRILFEHELIPGSGPSPGSTSIDTRPPIIISLDPRLAMIPEEDLAYIEELERRGWGRKRRRRRDGGRPSSSREEVN